jgi:hypothetical protein
MNCKAAKIREETIVELSLSDEGPLLSLSVLRPMTQQAFMPVVLAVTKSLFLRAILQFNSEYENIHFASLTVENIDVEPNSNSFHHLTTCKARQIADNK